ncbi:glutathione S-transferase [Phakopsora pachyrhizi]|nr:glutathione S-transferase [Phakopsora pachyrhizi]
MVPIPKSEQRDLHLLTLSTPNGKKVQIALEELKAIYKTEFSFELVDISTNVQKTDEFLKLNPNGRIPCLIDNKAQSLYNSSSPFTVMESAAILLYLAKKVDKDNIFGFSDDLERSEALQWLFFGMAGVGPMQGQLNHFGHYAPEKLPYAIKRYHDETLRLYGVIEIHLSGKYTGVKKSYLAGKGEGKYSWADIVIWPWVKIYALSGITEEEVLQLPNLKAWLDRIGERPAVKEGSGPKYEQVSSQLLLNPEI